MNRLLAFLACLAVLGACSTPHARIQRNLAQFQSYPEEARRAISSGKVALGFTEEMVRMALGSPSRIYRRTTAQGIYDVWVYRATETQNATVYPGSNPQSLGTDLIATAVVSQYFEAARVVFDHGKVVEIEELAK